MHHIDADLKWHVKAKKPDLVVVGTQGRADLRHAVLSSIAENQIATSSVDVLAGGRPCMSPS